MIIGCGGLHEVIGYLSDNFKSLSLIHVIRPLQQCSDPARPLYVESNQIEEGVPCACASSHSTLIKSAHAKGRTTMITSQNYWDGIQTLPTKIYKCGYSSCGIEVGADKGWSHKNANNPAQIDGFIYAYPLCKNPTFFDLSGNMQFPGVSLGGDVRHLPSEIQSIWAEIRTSTSHSAYTAAVLTGRKLLMHIAVEQGANTGLSFVQYVDHLVDNHYAPPNSRSWVDKIRTHGNEATHEILLKTKNDADEILTFLEMLLKFIYEFPSRIPTSP